MKTLEVLKINQTRLLKEDELLILRGGEGGSYSCLISWGGGINTTGTFEGNTCTDAKYACEDFCYPRGCLICECCN